jgi:uncharacterized membrane protein YjgN (DUF898 family)
MFDGALQFRVSAEACPGSIPDTKRTVAHDAVAPAPSPERPIAWVEPTEPFWQLALKNFGLTLATLGVYHFWGRAEARRKVMNAIRVNGRPLDYTGTGREAFLSFVVGIAVAALVVGVVLTLFHQATAGGTNLDGIREFRWQRLLITLPMLFLLGSVVYRKRQHVLRRTWLGGQRFDLSGHAWSYAWQHFWSAFLVPLTLGWAAPWRASRLEQRKIAEMHYGGQHFEVKRSLRPLYGAFAVLWFGGGVVYVATLVVLSRYIGPEILAALGGVSLRPLAKPDVMKQAAVVLGIGLLPLFALLLVYRKVWIEHLVSGVGFKQGRLRLAVPTLSYLWLTASNMILVISSLGALAPVAEARHVRFLLAHLEVSGDLALA